MKHHMSVKSITFTLSPSRFIWDIMQNISYQLLYYVDMMDHDGKYSELLKMI